MTTEAFLAALKRFFARRGKSTHIYSDNATNFIGAKNQIENFQTLFKSDQNVLKLTNNLANQNIVWHFIPPRSPHFGGLWEAAVKSLKLHMTRIIGNNLLCIETLLTYVTEIEGILNSRPITALSNDPNDINALTPAHFIIGEPITNLPEQNLEGIPANRLSSWEQAQQMKQHFWTRWHKEYLHELNVRKKWHTGASLDIKIGDIVLVKEDNVPPMSWNVGRIVAVQSGEDGVVRVATVKTQTGEYKRSIKKLSPLPL